MAKVRNVCTIKPGCNNGGMQGTIMNVMEKDGQTWYLVIVEGGQPPGLWYAAENLNINQGRLPTLEALQQVYRITKGNYDAEMRLSLTQKDAYEDEGFTVVPVLARKFSEKP